MPTTRPSLNEHNITLFGADATGTVSANTAITSMLSTYGCAYIPIGTFSVGDLQITGGKLYGPGTIIRTSGSTHALILKGSGSVIDGITFDSTGSAVNGTSEINLGDGCLRATVKNCKFIGALYSCVNADVNGNDDTSLTYAAAVQGFHFDNNDVAGTYSRHLYLHNVLTMRITNNHFRDALRDCIRFRQATQYAVVTNNIFENIGEEGISPRPASWSSLTAYTLGQQVSIPTGASPGVYQCIVATSTIGANPTTTGSAQWSVVNTHQFETKDAIDAYWSGRELIVSNNIIKKTAQFGFDIKGTEPLGSYTTSRVLITNNIIEDCFGTGINLSSASLLTNSTFSYVRGFIVSNNVLKGNNREQYDVSQAAIAIVQGVDGCLISGNLIQQNYSRGIDIANSDSSSSICRNISIIDNQVFSNGISGGVSNVGINCSPIEGLIVRGNIVKNIPGSTIQTLGINLHDYEVVGSTTNSMTKLTAIVRDNIVSGNSVSGDRYDVLWNNQEVPSLFCYVDSDFSTSSTSVLTASRTMFHDGADSGSGTHIRTQAYVQIQGRIILRSRVWGTVGNLNSFKIIQDTGANKPLALTIAPAIFGGNDMTIKLPTNGSSVATTVTIAELEAFLKQRIGQGLLVYENNSTQPVYPVGVIGPDTSTDNAIARFDGTTGKVIQDSGVTIDDSNNFSTAGTVKGILNLVGTTDTQTLTNKALSDSTTTIVDVSDATKVIKFDAAGTTGTSTTITGSQTSNRVLTLPDATDTLVGKATTDTLTNKTLSGNTATNLISGSGTLTLNTSGTVTVPNATDTLATLTNVSAKKTDSMSTNKLLGRGTSGTGVIEEITLGTNLVLSGTTLNATAGGGTLADADYGDIIASSTGTVLTIDANVVDNTKMAQMATKTYKGRTSALTGNPEDVSVATLKTDLSLNNVDNTSDATKNSAVATLTNKTLNGNTATNLISGSGTLTLNTSGTITVPNGTDTLVGKATTDTLTNKTLSGNTAVNLISGSGTLTLNTTGTVTLPNATDTLVGKATTDTLTNKTLVVASNTLTTAASGNLTSTELNAALAELQTDIDTRKVIYNNRSVSEIFDDFTGGAATGETGWVGVNSGTGTGSVFSIGATGHPGIHRFPTGTTNTGLTLVRRQLNGYVFGADAMLFEYMTRIQQLSTSTDEFQIRIGLQDGNGIDTANGTYFLYNRAYTFTVTGTTTNTSTSVSGLAVAAGIIDLTSIQPGQTITGTNIPAATTVSSVNAGAGTLVLSNAATGSGSVTLTITAGDFWICRCNKASTNSIQVTSSAVSINTWLKQNISINAAGTSVIFQLGGSTIATITTNIPIAGVAPNVHIVKTVGTTSCTMDIDYFYQAITLGTGR